MESDAEWPPRRTSDAVTSNRMSEGCRGPQRQRATESSLRTLLMTDPPHGSSRCGICLVQAPAEFSASQRDREGLWPISEAVLAAWKLPGYERGGRKVGPHVNDGNAVSSQAPVPFESVTLVKSMKKAAW